LTEIIIENFQEKTKGNTSAGQFWSPIDFSLFHRWIMFLFGYMVRLDVAFILDSGDRKHTLWLARCRSC
jgi:hypothetical protein